jgi:hypothetical protein
MDKIITIPAEDEDDVKGFLEERKRLREKDILSKLYCKKAVEFWNARTAQIKKAISTDMGKHAHFKWTQLVWQEMHMWSLIAEKVSLGQFNAMCAQRGFSNEQIEFLREYLNEVGLFEILSDNPQPQSGPEVSCERKATAEEIADIQEQLSKTATDPNLTMTTKGFFPMPTVYLCGGINGCTDSQCNDWRTTAKSLLSPLNILDPMRRDFRGREDECVSEIVNGDKEDIDNSDFLIVNATRPSWGTAMEVFYASEQGKTNIAFVGDSPVSPWLRHHCAAIVRTVEEACAEAKKY